MRIGIDLLGVQSPASRGRGIGRYARSLVEGLLRRGTGHEFVLYSHANLPVDRWSREGASWREVTLGAPSSAGEVFDSTLDGNPDALDAMLILSPFELWNGYDPPSRRLEGPAMAAIVYDLIPFRHQERYLTDPEIAPRFYRKLERLRNYDALLGISEATADDARSLLGLDSRRVVSIGTASDASLFYPPNEPDRPSRLDRFGIDRPFLFTVASTDGRKNLEGLLDAFAMLPESSRTAHQIVVACALDEKDRAQVRGWASRRGLDRSVVLAGEVTDDELRALYGHCSAFVFPSKAEGFGLPILEALHCGAPVIAGDNTSQPEAAGDAAILVNVEDASAIALAIERVLGDPDLSATLRQRGPQQAARFHWDAVADRALGKLSESVEIRRFAPGRLNMRNAVHNVGRSRSTTMRIGIDLLALQSPDSRGRGVGRYAQSLVETMLRQGGRHEFVLYRHEGLPFDHDLPDATVIPLLYGRNHPDLDSRAAINRVVAENRQRLDVFLTLNPFEQLPRYEPPSRPVGGPMMAAVVYDLIPLVFPESYLKESSYAETYYRKLAILKKYDRILTDSECTRTDVLRLLGLPNDRVVSISGAVDPTLFWPDHRDSLDAVARRALNRVGIRSDFILCVAGGDERKNVRGLIDAFATLPEPLRESHQLVVVCALPPDLVESYRHRARVRGVEDRLVLTGRIDDDSLRVLYQRCAVFAFPSRYEGLGLPLLEALHCGAPVVAGENSSQREVVGDAGLLVPVEEVDAFAEALARVLEDPRLNATLRDQGPIQASRFTWERTTHRALSSLEGLVHRRRRSRPRLAVVSPFPPKRSGIADYAMRLVDALSDRYAIELIHDEGYVPEPGLDSRRRHCVRARMFARRARVLGYRGILYQMGNSFYHGTVYDLMSTMPGIVTLHDFNLAAFQFWKAHQEGKGLENFRRELAHAYPDRPELLGPELLDWATERGGLQEACSRRQLHMNRRVFEAAEAVIVHSPWCLEQVRREMPEFAERTVVVRLGAQPVAIDPVERQATRARFGLPETALLFGSFGILTQGKMYEEAIRAFDAIADGIPQAMLLFVGADWENGHAAQVARSLGRTDRIRFFGRQPDADFEALVRAADIGVMLRRPPTYGETSAALLDVMRFGLPAIVTDVATFSDYPNDVVQKVRWESEGLEGLIAAMRGLASDASRRANLGAAAQSFVAANATWPHVAECYAEVIERVHDARCRAHRAG